MKAKYTFLIINAILFTGIVPVSSYAAKHIIQVSNFAFTPANIANVAVGDTIRWVWVSGSHTTTSTTIPSTATAWDQQMNSSSTSFEYKVSVAGNYNYVCTPHAAMGMDGSFMVTGVIPSLSVTPSNQTVTASAGNTSFTVFSNSDWTVSSNKTWCTATASGSGNGSINVVYEGNPLFTERIAEIAIHVSGLPSETVTVTQDGSTVSINEKTPHQIQIFPNPVSDQFTINTGELGTQSLNISLVDLSGRRMQTRNCSGSSEYRFDMGSAPEGIYFIRVTSTGENIVRRFIVTH